MVCCVPLSTRQFLKFQCTWEKERGKKRRLYFHLILWKSNNKILWLKLHIKVSYVLIMWLWHKTCSHTIIFFRKRISFTVWGKARKKDKKVKNKISNPITHSICLDSLLTSISSSSLDDPSPRQLLLSLYLLFYCFTSADDSDNASMLHTLSITLTMNVM